MSNFGRNKSEKIVSIQPTHAVQVAEASPYKGLGEITFQRITEPGKKAVADPNPNLVLSEIVRGVAINGVAAAGADRDFIVNATGAVDNYSGTLNGVTPGTDAVVPGSFRSEITLADTTVAIITDGPVKTAGEAGLSETGGMGMDGVLRDQFGSSVGTINYFTGDWTIEFQQNVAGTGIEDYPADYNVAPIFQVSQRYRKTTFAYDAGDASVPAPLAGVVVPATMKDEMTVWLLSEDVEVRFRVITFNNEDGFGLVTA